MADTTALTTVFEETRALLALPQNNFDWSSWEDTADALQEIDYILKRLREGSNARQLSLGIFFAPTGPIQEVSLSSGWGDEFIDLSNRFDAAMADAEQSPGKKALIPREDCACAQELPSNLVDVKYLGTDSQIAEVAVQACSNCGRPWLRYTYELEGFSNSGRWFIGALTDEQLAFLKADDAKSLLEQMSRYYYGGSYYGGMTGWTMGAIMI
jgi:hypothetical protein